MTQNFTHTVFCGTDKAQTKHFEDHTEAVQYANLLLSDGQKAVIRPYAKPKQSIDYTLERLQREGKI